jgi:hypothetical protein
VLSKAQCRPVLLEKAVGEEVVRAVLEEVGDEDQVDFSWLTGLLLKVMGRQAEGLGQQL